ncbi:TOPRIM nucleotidyl transferase/hydrolase domain-containing protein [Acrocarpospora sp. B8E8]|uniref:TOPRIM nucleotidyl transferase/hydrolase domain-containing protein n=1 Tax=Acrocarpospora sp. B8E8 TaxID=3153572 RepID=UPI00325F12F9
MAIVEPVEVGEGVAVTEAVPRAVLLVEGMSDRFALEVLARRRGRDLAAEGVRVVAMGGATSIGHFLDRYGPAGLDIRLAGLYDVAEERFVQRGLQRAGLGAGLSRPQLEALGFFVCSADLEDELIRALGPERVEQIVAAEGELRSFRTLQRQPAQRERSLHDQLRRLMGGRSGGKLRYARLMAEAIDLDRVPRPLIAVLDHI